MEISHPLAKILAVKGLKLISYSGDDDSLNFSFFVKVKPNSRNIKNGFDEQGVFQQSLYAEPDGGKANRELVQRLSELLNISQSSFGVSKGEKSTLKVIEVNLDFSAHKGTDYYQTRWEKLILE